MYKLRRPTPIRTIIDQKEVGAVFYKSWSSSCRDFKYICNARGFIKYLDGAEDEGFIIDYYRYYKNKAGMSPFDLTRTHILKKLIAKQNYLDDTYIINKRRRKCI